MAAYHLPPSLSCFFLSSFPFSLLILPLFLLSSLPSTLPSAHFSFLSHSLLLLPTHPASLLHLLLPSGGQGRTHTESVRAPSAARHQTDQVPYTKRRDGTTPSSTSPLTHTTYHTLTFSPFSLLSLVHFLHHSLHLSPPPFSVSHNTHTHTHRLQVQYRMHPSLSEFASNMVRAVLYLQTSHTSQHN